MTPAERAALVEKVAKTIISEMIYVAEPDTRAAELTNDELKQIASAVLNLLTPILRADALEEARVATENFEVAQKAIEWNRTNGNGYISIGYEAHVATTIGAMYADAILALVPGGGKTK